MLHYAFLLRKILASIARANERVHIHNERNFPQDKLDGEINVPFLLNEHCDLYFLSHNHCDLYFLSHNNSVYISLFNLRNIKKNLSDRKKVTGVSLQKTVTLEGKL